MSNLDETVVSIPPDNGSTVVQDLEARIKDTIHSIRMGKVEAKKRREQVNATLLNDEGYRGIVEDIKEDLQAKKQKRAEVFTKVPNLSKLTLELKNIRADMKEGKAALSDYLMEYERLTGSNEFELEDGTLLGIRKQASIQLSLL